MENKESNKKSELNITAEILKESLKSSLKNHKAIWIIGIIILIFAILLTALVSVTRQKDFVEKAADKLIPKQIHTVEATGLDMTFYREMNPEYVESETKISDDKYIQMYKYYYIDGAGNKQYLPEGLYYYTDENGENQVSMVAVGFLYAAGERLGTIQNILTAVKWVLIVGFIAALIIIWYFKDKKRNQQNKPKRIKKTNK